MRHNKIGSLFFDGTFYNKISTNIKSLIRELIGNYIFHKNLFLI